MSEAVPVSARKTPAWLVVTILGLSGLFYAYALWNAVAFLVDAASIGLSGYGWFVLLFAVVFPLIAFAIVYVIGRGRGPLEMAVVAVAGIGVVAVFWLNVLAHFASSITSFFAA